MKNLIDYIKKEFKKDGDGLIDHLKSSFEQDELLIDEILELSKDKYYLRCYMDTFLSVYIQEVEFLFFRNKNNKLNCVFKATLPDVWDFSWIYFDLPKYDQDKDSLFEIIKFSEEPKMLYCSTEHESLNEEIKKFICDSGFSSLKKGVNYSLKVDIINLLFKDKLENLKSKKLISDELKLPSIINDALSPLKDIISLSFIEDIRSFIEQNSSNGFELQGYLEHHKNHDVINIDVKSKKELKTSIISLSHISIYSSTNRFKDVSNGVKFIASIKIEDNFYKVEIEYLSSLSKIIFKIVDEVKFLSIKDDNTLPIKTNFTSICLREFIFSVSFKNEVILDNLFLVLGPNKSWQQNILKDSFKIDDFAFCFEYSPKKQNNYNFYTQCDFLLGGGLVHLGALYPSKQLSGELGLYQVISIDSIMKDLFYMEGFPKTNILDISIHSNLEKKEHSFLFELASNWSFKILDKDIQLLKKVFIKVDWDKNQSIFVIDSTMVIADVEIYLMAINTKCNEARIKESTWKFKGSSADGSIVPIGEALKEFLKVFKKDIVLPDFLKNLDLEDICVEFNSSTKETKLSGKITTEVFNKRMILDLNIEIEENKVEFKSKLTIRSCIFDIEFIKKDEKEDNEKVIFKAMWRSKGDSLDLEDIIKYIGIDSIDIPKDIDLSLMSATITYTDKKNFIITAESKNYGDLLFVSYQENKNEAKQYYLLIDIENSINLTNLPLVKQVFNKKYKLGIENIKLQYASDKFNNDNTKKINTFLAKESKKLDKDTQKGFCISLDLDIADHSEKLILATDNGDKKTKQNIDSTSTELSKDTNKAIKKSNDLSKTYSDDGTLWCKVNKKLGPISFEKIGLKYEEGKLFIAINSSLLASGLNIDLVQASISTRLDKFHPEFNLRGLGVGYDNSTFEISGTLITTPHKKDNAMEYTGGVVLKTKSFNLEAFGSYYDSDNDTSMFIFLEVDRVFGGPPSFVVTGLLGGFGYNSKLRIPDISEINDFPLTAGLDNPSLIGKKDSKKATTPTQAIAKFTKPEKTKPWITPKAGNIWVAAGVKFTSFELMNSIAILVGEFGKDFSLAIIGKSKGQYPKKGKPLVNFELDLRAYFNPNMGELSFISQLSDKSYLLDKNCHLRGGFAMCFWFGDNRYSGDFVISMGGYSPYFSKPSHYPALDRVGINWQINDNISIKGENYFTITPSAAMAGGNLNLLFKRDRKSVV